MTITLTESGSVYISFGPKPRVGYVVMPNPEELGITAHFDFDLESGRLVGIEIQDAEAVLPPDSLARFAKPSQAEAPE